MQLRLTLIAVAILCANVQPVLADEREDLETLRQTTLNLIEALVQNGILTQDKADALIRDAKRKAVESAAGQGPAGKVVRVPYVPQTVRNEIKEELRKEVVAQARSEGWATPNSLPSWLQGTKWESDLRLRFQQDHFARGNFSPLQLSLAEDPITIPNSQAMNDRWRARLRFGMEKQIGEMTSAGFRIATGNLSDPLSTNQTLGNSFDRYTLGVDRAYLKLEPTRWLSMAGGRIANPFFSTDLVWHPDLNFDGLAATLKPTLFENTQATLTAGAFPLQQVDPNAAVGTATAAKSKWLFGSQLGVDWQADKSKVKLGLAYYLYSHIAGLPNSGDYSIDPTSAGLYNQTVPQFRQRGNSIFNINQAVTGNPPQLYGLAAKFHELDLTGSVDMANLDPIHVVLTGDYVKNIGFDRAEILQRTGRDITPRTIGYQAKLTVGTPQIEKRGQWQLFGAYKYLQRDAVLDAYTDSDFRLGGTDAKGYIIGGSYGLDKNTWLSLRWLSADAIDGPPLSIDTLQIDLNARF